MSKVESGRGVSLRKRLPWPSRTVLLLAPLHLLAFLALYYGAMRIVRGEILRTHAHDARLMLQHEIEEFHPLMANGPTDDAYLRIDEFVDAHDIFELSLYDSDGEKIIGPGSAEDGVQDFLAGDQRESFSWIRQDGRVEVGGVVRFVAEERCEECHEPGVTLGAATVRLDMTSQIVAAQNRTSLHIGGLIAVWVTVVAVINLAARKFVRRSMRRLRQGLDGDSLRAPGRGPGVGKLLLDPVSERLYESLEEVLRSQRERTEQVSSRFHHTERLASLGQLAAGLAHEIKNPLAGIHGVLELLRDETPESGESDPERKKELYGEMLSELDRVNDTIHLLLSFARPASPKRAPVKPRDLVDGTVQLMRPGLAKKSIKLEVSTAPDLPEIAIDSDQIRQVLVNLISNAADAIEKNGTITVKATAFPDGEGLILAVEDNGPGISEEAVDQIFEPFYTTKFSGTGLGLSVVRSQVQQHGGRIEIESTPGEGTTFFVLLPTPSGPGAELEEGEA